MRVRPWGGAHHKNSNRTDRECCVRCGKTLTASDTVLLELNNADGTYRRETDPAFPESESQGWFAFGATCASRTMSEQAKEE